MVPTVHRDQNGIAAEMIDRRHEKLALDALAGSRALPARRARRAQGDSRRSPTAGCCIARTTALMRPLHVPRRADRPAGHASIRAVRHDVDGRQAADIRRRPTVRSRCGSRSSTTTAQFRDLLDEANRANASFYPVDPRGLAVFDTPMHARLDVPGPPPPMMPPLGRPRDACAARINSLRTLAEATDGLAIVDSNDLARRPAARRRRSELVLLPARLLLERQARWTSSIRSPSA
mgnify:CR=1 FL=1